MEPSNNTVVWLSDSAEKLYSSIIETRHLLVFPWLVRTILDRTPSSVLDYGAGDGVFLEELRNHFDGELMHFDPSPSFFRAVQARLRKNNITVIKSPQSLHPDSVDLITSTAVWMTLKTYEECIQYLAAQHRILKPGGQALISVTHPCFREEKYSSFQTNFSNEQYLAPGRPFQVTIADKKREIQFTDYHWNLSTMVQQAAEVGFRLLSLKEFGDVSGGNSRGSSWLSFEFGKR